MKNLKAVRIRNAFADDDIEVVNFIYTFMFVMQNCVKYKCRNYANASLNIFS